MAAAGVELLADLDRLAVLGFAEILKHVPDLARLRMEVKRFLIRRGVDLLVPIDYPGFNLPIARFARRRGIPVLYYVAPQVWAWRESRATRLAADAELVCVVLPFERDLLLRHGATVEFVGHPLLDRPHVSGGGPRDGSGPQGPVRSDPVLGLFPGSRAQEIRYMLPSFRAAADILRRQIPSLEVWVARARDLPDEVFAGSGSEQSGPPEEVASAATAAITKSGTITLQLAMAGVPMVVGYRMHPLSYRIARRLVKVDHIALANLVAGRRLVPELVQADMTPPALAEAVAPFLDPGHPERERVVRGLLEVTRKLGEPGAARRVAAACIRILESSP
jgi:lipid-A-disaccharide synthase